MTTLNIWVTFSTIKISLETETGINEDVFAIKDIHKTCGVCKGFNSGFIMEIIIMNAKM